MPAAESGERCILHRVHHPSVAHYYTLTLADERGRDLTVDLCPTGYHNVMAYKDYLSGKGPALDVKVGANTTALAQRIIAWEAQTGMSIFDKQVTSVV